MKGGGGRLLLPLPAREVGCFARIVLHRKAFVLAAARACRRAAPCASPDVVMRFHTTRPVDLWRLWRFPFPPQLMLGNEDGSSVMFGRGSTILLEEGVVFEMVMWKYRSGDDGYADEV